MNSLPRSAKALLTFPLASICAVLLVGGPSCTAYEWPPPEKEYAWIPYVESVSAPAEISALLDFDVVITLSTAANPELLDENNYKWLVGPGYSYAEAGEPYTVQVVRVTGPQAGDLPGSQLLVDGQPNQLKLSLRIPYPGQHTIRVLSAATAAGGGLRTPVLRGHDMGGDYFELLGGPPAGTAYQEATITVTEPRFEDAYYYGYLPFVEELVAPRQLLTNHPSPLLVRLSTSTGGTAEVPLSKLENIYGPSYLFYFADVPPAGQYASLLRFSGNQAGNTYLSFCTAESRDQGGMQLVLLKYPEYEGQWEKSGQTGYTHRRLEIEILDPPSHERGEYYDVRFPWVADVEMPERLVAGEPFALNVLLDSGLEDLSGGRGYFLQQNYALENGVLTVAPYYEPLERGLAVEEAPIVLGGLDAGKYAMRVYSVATPEQAGWRAPLKYDYGNSLTTVKPPEMPAELIQREFEFTVE